MALTNISTGFTLPQSIIGVNSTTGFASSGTIYIQTNSGVMQAVTYSGTSGGNQFTGCSGGTGTVNSNATVIQSSDDGYSVSMDIEELIQPAYAIGNPSDIQGTYSVFADGYATPNSIDTNRGFTISNKTSAQEPLPGQSTQYYLMVGFYVTGNVYESFVSVGSPTGPSVTNPNTGHALINTYVDATWRK